MPNKTFYLSLLVLTLVIAPPIKAEKPPFVTTMITGNYSEIRDSLLDIISGKGLNLSANLHAGSMLKRTADSFNIKKTIYAEAETIEFCSARIGHLISQADHQNILLCPFRIAIYNLADKPQNIYLSYRQPFVASLTSAAAIEKVNDLYQEIIKEAIDW